MAELGNRARVMGPQPIGEVTAAPAAMIDQAHKILDLIARGDAAQLTALAMPKAREDLAALLRAVRAGAYNGHEIIARARVAKHHYINARLIADQGEPFKLQMRLGESDGVWRIFEISNLTGRRSAWTRQQ